MMREHVTLAWRRGLPRATATGLALAVAACGSPSGPSGPLVPDYIWYVLDETSGAVAHDSSTHRYDITNLTGVTWASGANFEGTQGGGSVAVDTDYRSPPITLSAWLMPKARSDHASTQYVFEPYPTNAIGDDDPGQSGFGLGLNVWTDGGGGAALAAEDVDACVFSSARFMQPCLAHQSVGSTVDFVAGQEYFVAVTIGASGGTTIPATIYVDGAPFDVSSAGVLSAGPTTIWLGEHNDDGGYGTRRFFAGRIRDVRVYKRALEASEVQELYTAGPTLHAGE